MSGFKIEQVKWSWAEPVKNKNVYRDDEFVVTSTKDETLKAIDFLLNQPKGLTYTITVKRDGKYYTHYRHSMPCLGGLVKYADSHGKDKYWMNPYFPRDIKVAFPDGDIKFIGICRANMARDLETPFYQFVLSEESPWIAAFNHKKTIIFKNNYFVLTDMNTDPTVFYSLMRMGGLAYGGLTQKNWHPKADILFSRCYNMQADPRRLAGQRPIKISGGTWKEGHGYCRPYNESIFKEKLSTKYKDFRNLAGYPQAAQDNTYFVSVMKKEFGIDITTPPNEKTGAALLKAWDFFKKESEKLGDGFPS